MLVTVTVCEGVLAAEVGTAIDEPPAVPRSVRAVVHPQQAKAMRATKIKRIGDMPVILPARPRWQSGACCKCQGPPATPAVQNPEPRHIAASSALTGTSRSALDAPQRTLARALGTRRRARSNAAGCAVLAASRQLSHRHPPRWTRTWTSAMVIWPREKRARGMVPV